MRLLALAALAVSLWAPGAAAKDIQNITVAGGCFWCVESDFEQQKGVISAVSGYAGGTSSNPTYKQVTAGGTGHYEVVRITFDADILPLDVLLGKFFRSIDPTDAGGQFCDRGDSYRTAIFATGSQSATAQAALNEAQSALGQKIVTPILPAATFYEAEGYHQDYYQKSPLKYKFYRSRCGRDARVRQLWGNQALNH